MAYKLQKFYPENYSNDITDVVDALTLKHGQKPFLIGSAAAKVRFNGDFDLMQPVSVAVGPRTILADFKLVIKNLLSIKNVFIGDIKSGEIEELRILPVDINAKNYMDYRPSMLEKLHKIHKDKSITNDEYNETIKLLKPNLTQMDIFIIKQEIKFHIIRWTASSILKGSISYRGYKIGFNDYLIGQSVTKIDIIAWLNGNRYNEITLVYVFTKNGIAINKDMLDFEKIIIEQMPSLLFKQKYMKICKRINSIERLQAKPNVSLLKKFYNLFNSDLGLLSQVASDITAIEFLVENIKNLPKERIEFEVDQFRMRLGNITNSKYLKKQPSIIKLLKDLQEDIFNLTILENLYDVLHDILEAETKKKMKGWKLLPVPSKYLPTNLEGKGNEIVMKKSDLLKEHQKLIPLLERGTLAKRLKEAKDQKKEMIKYSQKN